MTIKIKIPKNHKISGVAPKPINVITEGFCKRYTEEPRYNGEMWAEFVGRSTAKCTKSYIWCYFDTHTSEGHIKLKAFLRQTPEGDKYCPEKSDIDFRRVPFGTNWRCVWKYKLQLRYKRKMCRWYTAELFNLIED